MPTTPLTQPFDTYDFLTLYMHATGVSQTPTIFHQWCAMAAISASVADRVWIEKHKGSHLSPNLYLVLLGPSGIGKGTAMKFAEGLLRDLPRMNIWNGMITAPKLIDRLGKPTTVNKKKVLANSKIFLMTPEMATSVGEGMMADKFVKLMTALYEGHTNWSEGTRTSGDVEIKDCNINWVAGSTPQWMVECLPRSSIDSGFLARSVIAPAEYDYTKIIPVPESPADFTEVYDYLKYRCFEFASVGGEFEIADETYLAHERWLLTRPKPEHDAGLEAAWWRDDDLAWKLSMVLSLSESIDMVIEARHMIAAQKLVSRAHRDLPRLLSMASQTPETEVVDLMRREIKRAKWITHRLLLQKMGARGKRAKDVHEAARHLQQLGEVEFEVGQNGGLSYRWR